MIESIYDEYGRFGGFGGSGSVAGQLGGNLARFQMSRDGSQDLEPQEGVPQEGEGAGQNLDSVHSLGNYYYSQEITFKDICEHMTGPVVSLIAHVVLIALLFTLMVFQPPEQRKEVQVEVKDVEMKEVETPAEPPPPPEEMSAMDNSVVQIVDRPVASSTPTVNVDMSDVKIDAASSLTINLPDVMSIRPDPNALKIPGTYGQRASKAGRMSMLKKYGADNRTEEAVEKALVWLRDNQNEDGTWGTDKNTRMRIPLTCFATLTFLAHGETPASQKYGPCMIRAIKKMVEWPNTMGAYLPPGDNYAHPIAAYTLSEIYGVTRIPRVKEAMDKTVEVVINNINKNGSYAYWYDRVPQIRSRDPITGKISKGTTPQPPSDLSFAGWNYQALKSALSAGCELPGLETAIDMSLKGLRMHCNEKEGGFSLGPGGKPDIGMTSLGILCMGLLGDGDSKECRKSLEWLKKNYDKGLRTCSWKYDKVVCEEYNKSFTYAIYTWYYQTQMLFQASRGQGSLWNNWNNAFGKTLIDEQNQDGSWLTPAEKYGKSILDPKKSNAEWLFNSDMDDPKDLKTYATAMCTLSLEVYYRYLPTYKLVKETTKKSNAKEDDLSF